MSSIELVLGRLSRPGSILLFLALYLVFVLGIFPYFAAETSAAQPIDLAFHYSVEQVYEWIESYGDEGRSRYMIGELTIDLLYPVVYTCLFAGLIGWLTNFEQGGHYRWLAALPASIWLFDLIENLGIVTMLYNYPQQLVQVANVTSWVTSIKWSLAFVVIAVTLLLVIRLIAKKLRMLMFKG